MLLEKRVPINYIIRKGGTKFLVVMALTVAITLVEHAWPRLHTPVPLGLPAFLGTAISLLLSFKLSQSYDRWWEARKIWGAIVNDSRTLMRQLLSFAPDESELWARMGHRQIAWCYCLGQSLRGLDWQNRVSEHLCAADLEEAKRHTNKPLALLQMQAQDLATLGERRLTDYQRIAIDGTLSRLTDAMGKAERIRNTVFPTTYRLFLRFFIYLFLTLLAFALESVQGAWQVLITNAIGLPFILLERTALYMQDPFSNKPTDTSVTAIARTIHINLVQMMGEDEAPEPLPAEGFYIM